MTVFDFTGFATGVGIPHGLFDSEADVGHPTCAPATPPVNSPATIWRRGGRLAVGRLDPRAGSILLRGGGTDTARHAPFKEAPQRPVDRLGIESRVAHDPPYCPKDSRIEHCLLPHLGRACQGVVARGVALVETSMGRVEARTGLSVLAEVPQKIGPAGRQEAEGSRQAVRAACDRSLPDGTAESSRFDQQQREVDASVVSDRAPQRGRIATIPRGPGVPVGIRPEGPAAAAGHSEANR